MEAVKKYNDYFHSAVNIKYDFNIFLYENNIYLGKDKDDYTVIVVKSDNPNGMSFRQKTKLLSLECNSNIKIHIDNTTQDSIVHILRCLSLNQKEREIFIELAISIILENGQTSNSIIETFNILCNFFANKTELSDKELIGLYGELYTVKKFNDSLNIGKYWQSKEKQKFDFSITDNLKLEIKSTIKNTRLHHFLHEQLTSQLYKIFILSYMFRYDDNGLSLFELINYGKEIFKNDLKKYYRLENVLKNTTKERLDNIKYDIEYTEQNCHFYEAENIPRFKEQNPVGVSEANYTSDLNNISFVSDDYFINYVNNELENNK